MNCKDLLLENHMDSGQIVFNKFVSCLDFSILLSFFLQKNLILIFCHSMFIRGFTTFGIKVCIVKGTGSGVLEDLTYKISEGSDQN